VIASQAVRVAPARHAKSPRPRHASHASHAARTSRHVAHRTTWELHTFGAVSAVIAFVFVLAMLYLGQTTTVSARGYEAQRLEQRRDELRRQNALLEVENARLDSPARIATEASRIGLVRTASVSVVQLEQITAKH
jgi:cell division protein FtsL